MTSPHIHIYILLLALGAVSNPLPEPTPPPLATPCTTYLTKTITGFHGNFTPEVIYTVYTTTDTVFSYVPCNGCMLSVTGILAPNYGGLGPQEIITARTTATEPSIVTSTVCSPETPSDDIKRVTKKPPTNSVTTITLSSKSWSTTITSTKYTTCRLDPVQDPDPGAIPKKRDSDHDQGYLDKQRTTPGSECDTRTEMSNRIQDHHDSRDRDLDTNHRAVYKNDLDSSMAETNEIY